MVYSISPLPPPSPFVCTPPKTRAPGISNPDQFREGSIAFLLKSLSSDAVFLFPPSQVSPGYVCMLYYLATFMFVWGSSQVALAALVHSSKQTQMKVDGYAVLSAYMQCVWCGWTCG